MKKVLVTGATGFIGKALVNELLLHDFGVIVSTRKKASLISTDVEQIEVGSLLPTTNWSQALKNVGVVIHLAGHVHKMPGSSLDSREDFNIINTLSTLNLVRQSIDAKVKRFIFISTIGVNGIENSSPFVETDLVNPQSNYAKSKYKAEQGLLDLAAKTTMDTVIVRPPIVYGPKVKANFALLLKWEYKHVPLPFGWVNNQRSLIALDNLVSFIMCCIDHPKAINELFLISDNEDVSTSELLQKVSKAFGQKDLLIPIPVSWMRFAAKLVGKSDVANRLLGSLRVDSSKARKLLGWKPVITMDEQLQKTVDEYLNEKTV